MPCEVKKFSKSAECFEKFFSDAFFLDALYLFYLVTIKLYSRHCSCELKPFLRLNFRHKMFAVNFYCFLDFFLFAYKQRCSENLCLLRSISDNILPELKLRLFDNSSGIGRNLNGAQRPKERKIKPKIQTFSPDSTSEKKWPLNFRLFINAFLHASFVIHFMFSLKLLSTFARRQFCIVREMKDCSRGGTCLMWISLNEIHKNRSERIFFFLFGL